MQHSLSLSIPKSVEHRTGAQRDLLQAPELGLCRFSTAHGIACLMLALLLAIAGSQAAEATASADYDKAVKPFLDEHCTR